MNLGRLSAGLSTGLLTAMLMASVARLDDVWAQARPNDGAAAQPGGFQTSVRPAPRRDSGDPEPATATPDPSAQNDQPTDPSADPTDAEPPRLRLGRRPVVDGDMSWPPEAPNVQDGVLVTEEADSMVDGVDPSQLDTRDPEELAAFEKPAAGFDPDVFS